MGDVNDLLPDLAAPTQARKIRAPKHDFKNGEGKVFAHRHDNGGGWVADTAHVAESVKVSSGSSVYGYARVTDTVTLSGKATIGDYARVMHNVQLSGNTIVRGSAMVHGSVNLTDRAFVSGRAELSGNTFAQGKVYIADNALVHNTRLNGPRSAYTLEITGAARVFDSALNGPSAVRDSGLLQGAHVSFAECSGAGKIINSTVNTCVDAEIVTYAYPAGSSRRRRAVPEPARETVPPLDNRLIHVQGVLINSRIQMRPCPVAPRAYLVNCVLTFYMQELTDRFTEFPTGTISDLQTNQLSRLVQYYQPNAPEAIAAVSIPVIAAVGVVPSFDQPRQRRIMRMEDA